jgi:hypothetical protein
MFVSTVLAYRASFTLAMVPLMRRTGLGLWSALSAIWIGEAPAPALPQL